jgi:hypothetical protein
LNLLNSHSRQARQGWANWGTPLSETGHQIYLILSLVFEGQNVALNEEAELVRGAQWGEILFFFNEIVPEIVLDIVPEIVSKIVHEIVNFNSIFCGQFLGQFLGQLL